MKGGQGRRFESIVTTKVPIALTEVAAAPLEKRTHPHAGRSHSHNNNLAATATGIKRALETTLCMCVAIKGWWGVPSARTSGHRAQEARELLSGDRMDQSSNVPDACPAA